MNFVVSFIGNHCTKGRGPGKIRLNVIDKCICYQIACLTEPWSSDKRLMCDEINKVYFANCTCAYASFEHFWWYTLSVFFFVLEQQQIIRILLQMLLCLCKRLFFSTMITLKSFAKHTLPNIWQIWNVAKLLWSTVDPLFPILLIIFKKQQYLILDEKRMSLIITILQLLTVISLSFKWIKKSFSYIMVVQ